MDKERLNELKASGDNASSGQKESENKSEKPKLLPKPGIMAWLYRYWRKIKNLPRKKAIIIGIILLAVIGLAVILRLTIFKPAEKRIYQVAVMVRSQNNKDPIEDRKTSLKAGDVLSVQDADHKWSKTESISYLILKMELTEEQKQKLTQSEEREIPAEEMSEEELRRIEEEKQRANEEGREYEPEPRTEVLRAREYYIDLSKKDFEGFEAMDLYNGQPFQEKAYDWGIVEKKKSVLKEK